jgi:TonB family protein
MANRAGVALSVVLLWTLAIHGAGASSQSLGARSALHDLTIQRTVVAADQIAYDIRVVVVESGTTVINAHETGKPGEPVDVTGTSGDVRIRVHLAYTPTFFSATLNALRGGTITDEFRTWWQLEPQTPAQSATEPDTGGARFQRVEPGVPGLNAQGALRVGGDVKAPRVVRRVEPIYSEAARRDRISGIVILELLVGKDGRVRDAVVLKPLPDGLSEAALAAVRQWEFEPGTLNGVPVDVVFNVTTNFKLNAPEPPQP